MKGVFLFIGALGIGAIWAMQSMINAGLARYIGFLNASALSFIIGTSVLVSTVLVLSATHIQSIPGIRVLKEIPSIYFMGGVIGALVVMCMPILVTLMGSGATLSAVIAGQLIMGVVMDAYGLFGGKQIGISSLRIIGVLLLLAGAHLVLKKY